ncbi:MAG TPA: GGDEF domain-containing protein, partial [Myxococcales bacterium]|nr:GGDEF domain-containing protein [Myxococcales bacterium]
DASEALECARILGRMLETERALLVSDHRSDVLEHLINASRALTNAFSPEQVYEAVVKSVCHFAPLRFSALIIQDNKTGIPMIAHAIGENGLQCCGKTLFPGASLATMVLKTPSIMPTSRTWTSQNGPLLDGGMGPVLSTGDPVVCIPLMAHKRVVGSLALVGSARFENEAVRLITLLAGQAAISVEHAQTLAELQIRATTDNLTSLDNRATIEQKLNQSVARSARQNQELSVLLLDLDHFKTINDTYGHPAGDMVLRQVSRLLEDCKRVNDSVGRFGGEEFIIILEDTGDAGARLVADRIRQRIASIQFPSSQGTFSITASIGFSISGRDAKSPADLVKRADQALYQVKNNGRNQVRGYRDNSTTIAQSA